MAQNYNLSESCFFPFVRYEASIQGIQYGSCSGSLGLNLGPRENLQNLQANKTQQATAGPAKRIQDKNSEDKKELAILPMESRLTAIIHGFFRLGRGSSPVLQKFLP